MAEETDCSVVAEDVFIIFLVNHDENSFHKVWWNDFGIPYQFHYPEEFTFGRVGVLVCQKALITLLSAIDIT